MAWKGGLFGGPASLQPSEEVREPRNLFFNRKTQSKASQLNAEPGPPRPGRKQLASEWPTSSHNWPMLDGASTKLIALFVPRAQ